jgi:hypothetical protein
MSQGSTEQLRGRDYVLALLWLARARAAAAASLHTTFVLRPGGVAGGNVYTDWRSLYTAFSQVQGPRWVWIDASLGEALVPAGTWNVDAATFGAFNGTEGTLNFESGAEFSFQSLTLTSQVVFQSASSTPVATMTDGALIELHDNARLFGDPTAAWAVAPAGVTAACLVTTAILGDGTNAALATSGTGVWAVSGLNFAVLADGSISSSGAGAVGVFYDASTQLGFHGSANITLSLLDLAAQVAYTPATPGFWNPVPATVQQGLDKLAAANETTTITGTPLGPALTVTLQSTAFTRALSGVFVVTALLSGTDAGDTDTVSAQLSLDGAPVGPIVQNATTFAGDTWNASITWIFTVADTLAHHVSISATGASNLTVAAEQAAIVVHELP